MAFDWARLADTADKFPKPEGFKPSYGTAGFRAEGSLLHSTMFRCGMLMAARSVKTGDTTGLVVTASHNPELDNGVKLVESTGYMLTQAWEGYADRLANAEGAEALCTSYRELLDAESVQNGAEPGPIAICNPFGSGRVMIAHDTRESSGPLVAAVIAGVEAVGSVADLRSLLTTPQLHWMVRQCNAGLPDSEADYFDALADAYSQLVASTSAHEQVLTVDCANGVGAPKLAAMREGLARLGLTLDLRNIGDGVLNDGCGADHVQKGHQGSHLPSSFEDCALDARCASIDGDADRLVYFMQPGGTFVLLDGDRIAVLAALLVRDLLAQLPPQDPPITVGVVQTAYANGSSTKYMKEHLGLNVVLANTGVKHLHKKAEGFDIGIYFEANGHGTVLLSSSLVGRLKQMDSKEAKLLLALGKMVNQAVGDAISGILLVEAALRRRSWTLSDWAALYADLPSCMLKVNVPDRSRFTTSHAETRTVTPAGLQPRIVSIIADYPLGRTFVRPSGTEDVVRVFAEAKTRELADKLANTVADFVRQEAASGS